MKIKLKFICIISIIGSVLTLQAQTDSIVNSYRQRYGLRLGMDISKLLRTALDKNYYGIQAVADYRISYKYYLAGELGVENKSTQTDYFNFKTTGGFLKLGVDYNTYNNWYGMENMIYIGARYATSLFEQDLESYIINDRHNQYWEESLQGKNPDILKIYPNRTAHWLELLIGIKVELLKNLYASADLRLKKMIYNPHQGFPNFWIPGFERVWDGGSIGVGYNYTLTYLIPFYRKKKIITPTKKDK